MPLKELEEDVYSFFKLLFNKWDKLFQQFEQAVNSSNTIFQQQSFARGRHNEVVGKAKKMFDTLSNPIAYGATNELKEDLQPLLNTISGIAIESGLRGKAFEQLKAIRNEHPTASRKLFSDLNAMIDSAAFLHLKPIDQHMDTTDLFFDLDALLRQTIDQMIPSASVKLPEMDNQATPHKPLKAFISYSKFDGESNTSGVSLRKQ